MGVDVIVVRGLGKQQKEQQRQTDAKILQYIHDHPGQYTREIINSGIGSPNTVVNSLKRLEIAGKIIKTKESNFFKKLPTTPKKSDCYIAKYSNMEEEKEAFIRCSNNAFRKVLAKLKSMKDQEFEMRKPYVEKLAGVLLKGLKVSDHNTIQFMQERLGIDNINESMIGFMIFKEFETFDLNERKDIPYPSTFYYKMLPKSLCYIQIDLINTVIDFINHNFKSDDEFSELIDNKFEWFSADTRSLIWKNFGDLLKSRGCTSVATDTPTYFHPQPAKEQV